MINILDRFYSKVQVAKPMVIDEAMNKLWGKEGAALE